MISLDQIVALDHADRDVVEAEELARGDNRGVDDGRDIALMGECRRQLPQQRQLSRMPVVHPARDLDPVRFGINRQAPNSTPMPRKHHVRPPLDPDAPGHGWYTLADLGPPGPFLPISPLHTSVQALPPHRGSI